MLPIKDCISRQAVLNLPKRTMKNYFGEVVGEVVYVKDIMELPSVTPKPKTGHWILRDDTCKCSNCKDISPVLHNYCPNCGVEMRGEEE